MNSSVRSWGWTQMGCWNAWKHFSAATKFSSYVKLSWQRNKRFLLIRRNPWIRRMPLKDLLSADVGDQIPGLKPDIQISPRKVIKKGGPKIYHYLSGGGFWRWMRPSRSDRPSIIGRKLPIFSRNWRKRLKILGSRPNMCFSRTKSRYR